MPGDRLTFTVALGKPVALEVNARFAIREGNRTIGSGIVTRIVE
jgi:elongation factor Tu